MTQEEKDLLLKELCARLPYGTKVNAADKYISTISSINIGITTLFFLKDVSPVFGIDDIKPYLRPMSSMTEKELVEWHHAKSYGRNFDFFNSHHLDYRYLIEKGIVLEAPEGMYEIQDRKSQI